MKKLIMAAAVMLSAAVLASVDVYKFKSSMKVYSLTKKTYTTTSFNGELTIDSVTGEAVLKADKRDTREKLTLAAEEPFMIVTGKKDRTGAVLFELAAVPDSTNETDRVALVLTLSGSGKAKTKTEGCGPCGDETTCTKIARLSGRMTGHYDCGCPNPQHFEYTGECGPLDEKTETRCPVYGSWRAWLKTVDGKKYK